MTRHPLPPSTAGELAIIGLGASGVAAARLLRARGYAVYVSDSGTSPAAQRRADEARSIGADVTLGAHDLARVARAALVVVSPGVPPDAAPLAVAREADREIISEIELALRATPALRYIAITGTNGKTTTTALVGRLLRALGVDAPDAGNIGTPLSEVVMRDPLPGWVALELSSFQLHDTPSVDPAVGVLTNLSPDHLDRYASVDEYYGDKRRMFVNAGTGSRRVVNGDDPAALALLAGIPGQEARFSLVRDSDAWFDRGANQLVLGGRPLLARAELPLLGDHNVANALAAALAVTLADPQFSTDAARATVAGALRTFRALAHRLEVVADAAGVQWINDSKATNVASTLVAVQGMTRPTVLLLGGRHKGEPYTGLASAMRPSVKRVIAYGEAGPIVAADLGNVVPVELVTGSFEDVVERARAAAAPGDAILMSPACSSYDMFNNYMERGERFRELATRG